MSIMEMLGQSVVLTILGMSVVFGFLTVVVIVVTLTGKLINKNAFDKEGNNT